MCLVYFISRLPKNTCNRLPRCLMDQNPLWAALIQHVEDKRHYRGPLKERHCPVFLQMKTIGEQKVETLITQTWERWKKGRHHTGLPDERRGPILLQVKKVKTLITQTWERWRNWTHHRGLPGERHGPVLHYRVIVSWRLQILFSV